MAAEIIRDCSREIFRSKLKAKEKRLPKSIRTQIRRLKEAGRLEQVAFVRKTAEQKRSRQDIAADEFGKTIIEVVCTDDPIGEAVAEIKMTWLMHAVGFIETQEERKKQILEILDSKPIALQPQIEALMPEIAREVEPLLPPKGPRPPLPLAG